MSALAALEIPLVCPTGGKRRRSHVEIHHRELRMNIPDTPEIPVRDELHSTDRVIRWVSHPPIHVGETTLSTRETALLDFLRAEANQDLTPSEILSRSPLSGGETMAGLSGLVPTGGLEAGGGS